MTQSYKKHTCWSLPSFGLFFFSIFSRCKAIIVFLLVPHFSVYDIVLMASTEIDLHWMETMDQSVVFEWCKVLYSSLIQPHCPPNTFKNCFTELDLAILDRILNSMQLNSNYITQILRTGDNNYCWWFTFLTLVS